MPSAPISSATLRRRIRFFTAVMAAVVSALYFLIGFQIVAVIEPPEDQAAFALPAGIAFALGALVTLAVDKRWVWIAGGIVQALIILMYFALSSQREPAFEGWGISIRVAQMLLLAALGYLAIRRPVPTSATAVTTARLQEVTP
jgi:predicted secreted protein